MMRINIVCWHNGGGLSRDIDTLVDVLPADRFQVSLNGAPREQARIHRRRIVHRARNQLQLRFRGRELAAADYDINLFLEDITPRFFKYASANLFIPNPEWFKDSQRRYLQGIDSVLCKTREAQQTFSQFGCTVRFIGFTSEDRSATKQPHPENIAFLHIAGRSWQKGTAPLIELWRQNPEWPMLTVVQNARTYNQAKVAPVAAPNITHILKRLDDAELQALQNNHAVHLCPSESEGFGHCIAEAMSCGALTLTTNAPPMNELITRERGVLVDYNRTVTQRSGANYYVDPADLERKIQGIIAMDAKTRKQLGDNAQRWYRENDSLFRKRLLAALQASLPTR